MTTLLASLLLAVTTFFTVFAGLTLRSTHADGALFWQLERMAFHSHHADLPALNDFAGALLAKTEDHDLLVCANFQLQRSGLLLSMGLDLSAQAEPLAFALVLRNLWRHPSALLMWANVAAQGPLATAARSRCLEKFSHTDADRNNAAIASCSAVCAVVLLQAIRRISSGG